MKKKKHLITSANQFAFKQYHSTANFILALKETIGYYYSMNTPVFNIFMCKNAFGRVRRSNFLLKLVEKRVPLCLVYLLQYWYMTQRFYGSLGSSHSEAFSMSSWMRQGSIISSHLLIVYVNELKLLRSDSKLRCHTGGVWQPMLMIWTALHQQLGPWMICL